MRSARPCTARCYPVPGSGPWKRRSRTSSSRRSSRRSGPMRRAGVASPQIVVAICLLLSVPGSARAQDQPVLRLTLAEARARALDASHRLAEARAREAATLAGVDARVAAERPFLTAQAGYTRTNHVAEFV